MFARLLARLNVNARIYLLIGIAGLGIAGIFIISASSIATALKHEREEQTRRLVETATSMINKYQTHAKAGEISEEEARKRALDSISALRYDSDQYFWVNDWDGNMLAHPRKELVGTNILDLKDARGDKMFVNIIETAKKGGGTLTYFWKDAAGIERPKISYVKSIPEWKWAIASGTFFDDIMKEVWKLEKNLGIEAGILLILSLVIAGLIGGSISKPIRRITKGLAESAAQVAAASGQVSSSSQQLAQGASEQAAAIEETSSSLEEMSSMIKQNADNANRANKLMSGTKETVARAGQSMETLTASMGEISRASQETSKIIKTIDEIAFQTNLLALNAAVEAARAGEAGAGFAVVADEVRNLAMRAAEAAKNTAGLIEHTVKKVTDGSEVVVKTSSEFSQAAGGITTMGELVGEITAASNEQAKGIEQINRAVSEMEKVVHQNASNAEESASASEEMSAQAEYMKDFIGKLVALVGADGSKAKKNLRVAKRANEQPVGLGRLVLPAKSVDKKAGAKISGTHKALSPAYPIERTKAESIIPFDDTNMTDF